MGSENLQPPRGMRDFYPEDMLLRNFIFDAWKQASVQAGFDQYDASVVETLDLLKRKSGEEIVNQIYNFQDKSGRDLALRPEMTPTLARMISAKQSSLPAPVKWFTIAQCFRYERMTKGRKREHYQWNMDIIGEDSVAAEAEIISAAIRAIQLMGLEKSDFKIHFSSRALLASLLLDIGIPAVHHQTTFLALDKRGKIDDTEIQNLLAKDGISDSVAKQIFQLLEIASIEDAAKTLKGQSDALDAVRTFLSMAESYGIADTLKFDISVVRGLTYYTGIVFEAFDANKTSRAIFGGGRYDNLLSDVGGTPASGVGLGFGDVVIADILTEKGIIGPTTRPHATIIGFMEAAQQNTAISVASSLRNRGESVDLALKPEKPKHFFSKAGKGTFSKAIYIGPDDIANGSVRIKNLCDRTEQAVKISEMI